MVTTLHSEYSAEHRDFRMDETENLTFTASKCTRRTARGWRGAIMAIMAGGRTAETVNIIPNNPCLLYTSDAADD